MKTRQEKIEQLRQLIARKAFIKNEVEPIGFYTDPDHWIFDFRRLFMNGEESNLITDIFFDTFDARYPFQVCALEVAGVPLATAIVNKLYARGKLDANGFFIRKSRKKTGLHRMIEGTVAPEKKIILVDDVINSGNTFWRQIEVLESLDYKVDTVWSILRYRDRAYYQRFFNRDINVESLFELDDFSTLLPANKVANLKPASATPPRMPFQANWKFQSEKPSLGWVVQKSQPILDDERIYFGADNEIFWCINQSDGSVVWKKKLGSVLKKKSVFSNPVLHKDTVIFGSYDGNVYCLDKYTGAEKWISFEADWVGSSPAIAPDLNLVFIGLEFGLFNKLGGIIALNLDTGKPVWSDQHIAFTHSSPLYIKQHAMVVIGSNDGKARLYDAKTGTLLWHFTTFGAADYKPDTGRDGLIGYSSGDIKESFVYDVDRDYIIFGAVDGFLYILDRKTGHLVFHYKCKFGIFSTPLLYKNRVYFTSTDKRVRCLDLDTFQLTFEHNLDNTRLFSNPTEIDGRIYVGTNGARLFELDPTTGETTGYYQATERITMSMLYNQQTRLFYLPTFANEIICLERKTLDDTCS